MPRKKKDLQVFVPKPPGMWVIGYHNALIEARIGKNVPFDRAYTEEGAETLMRHMRELVASLKEYRMHPTAEAIAQQPRRFRMSKRRVMDGLWHVEVTGMPDTHARIKKFLRDERQW